MAEKVCDLIKSGGGKKNAPVLLWSGSENTVQNISLSQNMNNFPTLAFIITGSGSEDTVTRYVVTDLFKQNIATWGELIFLFTDPSYMSIKYVNDTTITIARVAAGVRLRAIYGIN